MRHIGYDIHIFALIIFLSTFSGNPALSQELLEAPSPAKNPSEKQACPLPHIKDLIPHAAAAGAKVTIVGFGFGSSPGVAVFPGTMQAVIISWQPQRIVAVVPQGTQDGHVTVINGCSNQSKEQSGGYFKIISYSSNESK